MANEPITGKTLADSTSVKSELDKVNQYLETVQKQLDELTKSAIAFKKALGDKSNNKGDSLLELAKQIDALKKKTEGLTAEEKLLREEKARLTEVNKEALRIEKQQAKINEAQVGSLKRLKLEQKALKEEIDKSANATEEQSKQYKEISAEVNKLTEAQKEKIRIDKLEATIANEKKGSYKQLSAQYSLNRIRLAKLSDEEIKATKAGRALQKQTAASKQATIDFDKSINDGRTNVGRYSEDIRGLVGDITGIPTAFKAAAVAAGAIAIGNELRKIADETNMTASSISTLFGTTGEDLDTVTEQVSGIAAAYKVESQELTEAAKAFQTVFKTDTQETFDLLDEAFAKGINVRGEAIELIKEYSTQLKKAGLSAKESLAFITQSEKSGFFSDKAIDTIKEGAIRLNDLTKAQKEALDLLGKDTAAEVKNLTARGKNLEAIKLIAKEITKTGTKASTTQKVISDLFGGAGEDVGIEFFESLSNINTELDKVPDAGTNVTKASADLSRSFAELKASITGPSSAISTFFAQSMSLFADALTFIKDNQKAVISFTAAIGGAVLAYKAVTSAQKVFNAVMKKNPIGLILSGITLLIPVVLNLADAFKNANSEFGAFQDEFSKSRQGMSELIEDLKTTTAGTDERRIAVEKLKSAYGEYLPKLDLEKASLSEIEEVQKKANAALIQSFILKKEGAKIAEEEEKKNKALNKVLNDAIKIIKESGVSSERAAQLASNLFDQSQKLGAAYLKLRDDGALANPFIEAQKEIGRTIKRTDALSKVSAVRLSASIGRVTGIMDNYNRATKESRGTVDGLRKSIESITGKTEGSTNAIDANTTATDKNTVAKAKRIQVIKVGADSALKVEENFLNQEQQLLIKEIDDAKKAEDQLFLDRQEYARNVLKLREASGEQIARVEKRQHIARLNRQLEQDKELTEQQKINTAQQIKIIEAELDKAAPEKKGDGGGSFLERLGFSGEGLQGAEAAVQQITAMYHSIRNARLEAAQASTQAANEEVQSLRTKLNAEIAAEEQGQANRRNLREKELAIALQQQEKAAAQEEKIKQRQQVVDLITASAGIWAQFKNPIFALPAIAVMWASFGLSKLRANKETKREKGGFDIMGGGSHASGNDTYTGTNSRSEQVIAEGGEGQIIVSKKAMKNYSASTFKKLSENIENGTFSMNPRFSFLPNDVLHTINNEQNISMNTKGIETRLDTIARVSKKEDVTVLADRTIYRKGRSVRVVR